MERWKKYRFMQAKGGPKSVKVLGTGLITTEYDLIPCLTSKLFLIIFAVQHLLLALLGTYDEAELLSGIMNLEEGAFASLYSQYYRQLCFYTEEITGHRSVAEDIASESFIKLLNKRYTFNSLSKLKSFLFTVAHNAALDYLKAEKRHQSGNEQIGRLSDQLEQPKELACIQTEVLNAVFQEIEQLPVQCREVIRLSFIEGLSITEIADKMNIAYKTVQNQKTRGVQLLRSALLRKSIHPLLLVLCIPHLFE